MTTRSEASTETRAALIRLRQPATIRERCGRVYAAAEAGTLRHFTLRPQRLDAAVDYVVDTTRQAYPDLDIPYHSRWRHFGAGGRDRWAPLAASIDDPHERGRVGVELAVVSVLLDAGAGDTWRYRDDDGRDYARSEGLALASLRLYRDGRLSARAGAPRRADAAALSAVDDAALADAFQVDAGNPLAGVGGRAALLRELGNAVWHHDDAFADARLGGLYDYLLARADRGALSAVEILGAVLELLGPIWPSRLTLAGNKLGDVWPHPAALGDDDPQAPGAGLVPFHKLSQWLSYSLVEPLEWAGVRVTDLDRLTGLPEYRNGGLLIDLGVLEPNYPELLRDRFDAGSEAIVEWRALTVVLLDRIAEAMRRRLGLSAEQFPLARALQGGTWSAGRRAAAERRGGPPPIRLRSDGTVF